MLLGDQIRRVAVLVEQEMAAVVVVRVVVRVAIVRFAVIVGLIVCVAIELTHVGRWFCLTEKIAVHHGTTTTAAPLSHAIWRICAQSPKGGLPL